MWSPRLRPFRPRAPRRSAAACAALLVVLLAAALRPAVAQDGFSLADALAMARGEHPALRAAGGRRQSAVGQARQDAAFLNPTLEYRRENIGGPIAPDEFVTAALGVDAYGRRYALRGLVGAVAARAAADSTTTARTVEYDVARAYWRAALAVALRGVADAQRQAFDSLSTVQVRRAREGAIAEGAAMRTQLEAARLRLVAATARADAERARGDLARALALPLDRVPWPTDPVDVPGGAPAVRTVAYAGTAVGGGAGAAAEYQPEPDARALVEAALRQRPEVVAARARLVEAQRRAGVERLGGRPGVGGVAGYKRTAAANTGLVGVYVSVPLFDRNQGGRARAAGDLVAAENDLRAAEAQVTAEVEAGVRAYATLLAESGGAATSGGGALNAASLDARGRDVAAVTEVAYREGAATLLELLDAVRSRGDVRAAALRWAADLRLARLDLERATGAPAAPATTLTK